jgi:branched-chain amino acid transport system permease protein
MRPCGVYNISYSQDRAVVRTKLQWGWLIALFIFLFTFPLFGKEYYLTLGIFIGITIISLHGLNILMGYTGQLSLGHAAFMGVGAFTAVNLVVEFHSPFVFAILGGGLVTAIIGILFGAPALRIKGFYLVMATLAAHYVIFFIIHRWEGIGGFIGKLAPPVQIGPLAIDSTAKFYLLVVIFAIVGTYLALNVPRSNTGRAMIAVRDQDLAGMILGINISYYKLLAFGISSFYAGVAGGLLAFYLGIAHTQFFSLTQAVWYLGMLIVGGLGSTLGPIFGAIFFQIISELSIRAGPLILKLLPGIGETAASQLANIFWAVVILFFIIKEPRGINHSWVVLKNLYRLHPFSRKY